MLSRASSKSGLRRSKSSASVKTRRHPAPISQPFDPQDARLQALTAASLAMGKWPQHSSGDSEGSFGQSCEIHAEQSRYSRRRHNPRSAETAGSVVSHSLATSRSQTPLRDMPPRERSLQPVPERPISTEDFALQDDVNVPSEPSSYRRVRKSKSMFGARLHDPQNSPRREHKPPGRPSEGFSRKTLRRSLSFFKGKPEVTADGIAHSDSRDPAVRLARDQFLQGLVEQQRSEVSESSSDKRTQREQRPFRKSFRSTSANNSPTVGSVANHRSRGSKSKLFSTSIKNGFRRLFGRSSASQEGKSFVSVVSSPLRTGGTESSDSNSITMINTNQTPRASTRHHAQPAFGQRSTSIANRPASLRTVKSSGSVSSSAASVSSWADSMATNTMTSRHGGAEQGYLAAIHEGSRYQATSRAPTARPCRNGNPPGPPAGGFDTQRVYSALMRRIDQTDEEKRSEGDSTPKEIKSKDTDVSTPATIRTVKPTTSYAPVTDSELSSAAQLTPTARRALPVEARQDQRSRLSLTPQQVAHYNEGTEGHQKRPSPYLSESIRIRESLVPPGTPTPNGHRRTPRCQELESEDDNGTIIVTRPAENSRICQSPSVYSRTASGVSLHTDEYGSNQSDSENEGGTATILTSHRVEYSPTRKNAGGNWDRVGKGSGEWKQWMSSQLDMINPNPVAPDFMGHYREEAQIWDDGFELEACFGGRPSGSTVDSPGKLEDTGTNRPPLVELSSAPQGNNFSRPLRHAPSGPISLRNTPARKPSVTTTDYSPSLTAIMTGADSKTASSKGSSKSRSPSKTPNASPIANHKTGSPGQVMIRTRDMQRNRNVSVLRNRLGQYRTSPSTPDRTGEENGALTKENQSLHNNTNANSPPLRKHAESELAKLENIHSTIGSKRMVDIFLTDRRRTMGLDEDSDDVMGPEPAFL